MKCVECKSHFLASDQRIASKLSKLHGGSATQTASEFGICDACWNKMNAGNNIPENDFMSSGRYEFMRVPIRFTLALVAIYIVLLLVGVDSTIIRLLTLIAMLGPIYYGFKAIKHLD